jgi:crotonobetainyl-CoA:carnitine CoA-transferase CaiB-like acyl-CoA transferase
MAEIRSALEGIRVLDLGRHQAAPRAAHIMARLGAEVIKVEPRGNNETRTALPRVRGLSTHWISMNAGKKSLSMDLRTDKAKEILRELVKVSDVFIQNFRPGTIAKMGFSWDVLNSINPRIIMCNISAYGQYGPFHERVGLDVIGQAMSGHMSLTGYPETPPVRSFFSIVDRTTALHGVIGVLAALNAREVTGEGQTVDVCLADSGYSWMEHTLIAYLEDGSVPGRRGNRAPGAPANTFMAKDGWIMILAATKNVFERLCHLMNKPEWLENPELQTQDGRNKHVEMLEREIGEWVSQYTLAEAAEILSNAEIACQPVNDIPRASQEAQLWERELLWEAEHPYDGGKVHVPGMAIKLSDSDPPRGPLSAPGQHTEEILTRVLDYTREDVERLHQDGVVYKIQPGIPG